MIHRYWSGGELPQDFTDDLAALHLDVEIRTWTHLDLPGWIQRLVDKTAPLVIPERQHQHTANVARIGLLWEFGGWWADCDLLPHRSFSELPQRATAAHRNGSACNCWMAFGANDQDLALILNELETLEPAPPRRAVEVSGEQLLWRMLPDDVALVQVDEFATHYRWTSRRRNPA